MLAGALHSETLVTHINTLLLESLFGLKIEKTAKVILVG